MYKTESILNVTPSTYDDFSCGYSQLDEYLTRFAKSNHKKDIGRTFVLIPKSTVVGYYTISMGEIESVSVPENLRKGLPKYPIPVARIGRLAVHADFQGKGFGKFLLVDAFRRIVDASHVIAAYAVVVDAKDDKSKPFYIQYGFMPYANEPFSLFLPISTIKKAYEI